MYEYRQYLVILGAILNLIGGGGYIIDTIKGRTKPNRVSWFLWSIPALIGTAAALAGGATWAVVPVFMAGFIPLSIFFASFVNKKSYWQLKKTDYMFGAISVLALILWWLTDNPNVAVIFAILADALAAIPTVIKAWKYPESESGIMFVMGLIAVSTGLLAVKSWVFSEYAFLIYLIFWNMFFIIAVYRGRFTTKKVEKV